VQEGEGEVLGDVGGKGQGESWDEEGLEEFGGIIIWLISISFRGFVGFGEFGRREFDFQRMQWIRSTWF